ncbi:MAG: hypothetical protein HOF76_14110, partial [Candidatus Scalindua sp.]|nr:hypothetical protein [Candidatus Scalindua sp.]
MKRPYLLIMTATLCLVLSGGMSLAKDSSVPRTNSAEDKETLEACKQAAIKNPDDANT